MNYLRSPSNLDQKIYEKETCDSGGCYCDQEALNSHARKSLRDVRAAQSCKKERASRRKYSNKEGELERLVWLDFQKEHRAHRDSRPADAGKRGDSLHHSDQQLIFLLHLFECLGGF